MRVVGPAARLHDIIIRQPFNGRVGFLVDRSWMKSDCLVVRHVPPTFALSGEELGIETPCYYRVDHDVVCVVDVTFLGECEELSLSAAVPSSVSLRKV